MRVSGLLATLAAICLTSCAPAAPRPESGSEPRAAGSAAPGPAAARRADASPLAGLPGGAVHLPLAQPGETSLRFEVRAVEGERVVLLVASDPLRDVSYLRTLDEHGELGPPMTMVGRHPVAGFELEGLLLMSSDGERLCVERPGGPAPVCHAIAASRAVVFGGHLVLIEEREPEGDEHAEATAVRRKGKPGSRSAKRRAASRRRERTRDASKPPKIARTELWAHRLRADGSVEDTVTTGVSFEPPLPGMGLVDAAAGATGIQMVWYEQAKEKRQGRERIARAKLRSGRLDADAKLVPASLTTLFEGDRRYGYIDGHRSPRLLARGGRVIYLGRFDETRGDKQVSGWQALMLPGKRALSGPPALFAVDPGRLAETHAIASGELATLEKVAAKKPTLALHQPVHEAARVAWAGELGAFLAGGVLHAVSRREGVLRTLDEPFVARRARLYWGAIARDGHALALDSEGLVAIDVAGRSERRALALDGSLEHADPPVRIGDGWWLIRPSAAASGRELLRIWPEPAEASGAPPVFADSARLIGGAEHGWLLALDGPRLGVWRLSPDGSASRLTEARAPFGQGFSATEREGGGAIAVGPSPDRSRTVAVAIDARGAIGPVVDLGPAAPDAQLHPFPGGGAWWSHAREVVWLDNDAAIAGRSSWPSPAQPLGCIDGTPLRATLPASSPGTFHTLDPSAVEGRCVLGAPVWTRAGLRWLGTRIRGLDSQPEAVLLPGGDAPVASAPAAASPARAPAPAPRPCPPDMVSIAGRYCIDRFEAQLTDARTGVPLSPDYPLEPTMVGHVLAAWTTGRLDTGDLHARAMPLPPLLRDPEATVEARATSRAGVIPSGYLSSYAAEAACRRAGKRLCSVEEWVAACRGEQNRLFPYGDDYEHGRCNVYRYAHPAATLHGNAAIGHLDPRLNRARERGAPLLRRTGATPDCASRWGDDAVYDMVGNLDEWVDKKGGAFAGGFYSRLTRSGCDAMITVHPRRYMDYSLGVRCCQSAR